MRRVVPFALLSLALLAVGIISVVRADDKPKYTIKEVMKEHKPKGLKDKVSGGTATADEKAKLVEMYEAMGKAKPPKGDEASWKKFCDELTKAAKEVKDGKEGGLDNFKKAVSCKGCHEAHKPAP